MSETVLSVGKLVPIDFEQINLDDEDVTDLFYESNILIINGKAYRVVKEVDDSDDLSYQKVIKNKDGTYDYVAIFYNGCTSLMEILEESIKEDE